MRRWKILPLVGAATAVWACTDSEAPAEVASASTPLVWEQVARVYGSDPISGTGQRFGVDVKVDGDTVAIGASAHDSDHGAVYVFRQTPTGWSEEARLEVPSSRYLGYRIALSGDRLIALAPRSLCCSLIQSDNDPGIPLSADLYAFQRTGSTWTFDGQLVPLDPPGPVVNVNAVSLDGDRAVFSDESRQATYIFVRTAMGWEQEFRIPLLRGSVAISGDTLVVTGIRTSAGWPDDNRNDPLPDDRGAWIFERTGSNWIETQQLVPDTGDPHSAFWDYNSLRGVADLHGDTLVLGSWVFERSGGVWTHTARLSFPPDETSSGIGVSLSPDQQSIAIVATNNASSPALARNYLFVRAGSVWTIEESFPNFERWRRSLDTDGRTYVIGKINNVAGMHDFSSNGHGVAYLFGLLAELGEPCSDDLDCASGQCVAGFCADPTPDAGVPMDAATPSDAGSPPEAGLDAATPPDAGPPDAGLDDAGSDSGAGLDAAIDAAVPIDAETDSAVDAPLSPADSATELDSALPSDSGQDSDGGDRADGGPADSDSGTSLDAAVQDAGADDAGAPEPDGSLVDGGTSAADAGESDEGSGCSASQRGTPTSLLCMLFVLVGLRRSRF